MVSRRDFLKLTAASGATILVGLPFGSKPLWAITSTKPGELPRIDLRVPEQLAEVHDDQGQPLFQAHFEVDGRSNKNGRANIHFNMQYLILQQKIQTELKIEFAEALITETTFPAGAIFSGSGWSIRGRERQKTKFTAKFRRSVDDPDYLVIEFAGPIFVDANGPPSQVDWRSEVMGTITFRG